MEIYRVPPYPLTTTYPVADPDTEHTIRFDNSEDLEYLEDSDMYSLLEVTIPEELQKYDAEYALTILDDTGEIVVEDTIRVVRPYIDVTKVFPDEDFSTYSEYEAIARLAIDNIVGGFYYQKHVFERMGTGSDVLPLGHPVRKLIEIKENGEVVFDGTDNTYDYVLSDNGLYIKVASTEDIMEGSPIKVPTGSSDTYTNMYWGIQFGNDYVYTVTAECGWPVVPTDIQTITKRMVKELACGTPNYLQKYVVKYETDEFRTDFDRRAFSGTGDLIVDQTLKRYWGQTLFHNVGVL
jgi:hypothetical protein